MFYIETEARNLSIGFNPSPDMLVTPAEGCHSCMITLPSSSDSKRREFNIHKAVSLVRACDLQMLFLHGAGSRAMYPLRLAVNINAYKLAKCTS